MLKEETAAAFFLESQNMRVAMRQITCPHGFCLVVEDEPPIAKYLVKVLNSKGIDAKIVDNSIDAIDMINLHSTSIICIVLDLNLEQTNSGQKILELLEEHYRNIPYVVYTADQSRETALRRKYPHINVAIKGRNNTNVLLNALGITNNANVSA